MSLSIRISTGPEPKPKYVSSAEVVRQAREAGHPNADKALAITRAFVRVNQRALGYDVRTRFKLNASPQEYRFRAGTLLLTIWQTMHIANDLPSCAREIWIAHEQKHVRDNMGLKKQLEWGIRANSYLKTIFFNPQWFSLTESAFRAREERIRKTIEDIWNGLVRDAVQARDTPAEYAQVQRRILRTCPDPFYHEVVRGDWLSKLALFYYGNYRFWPSIYDANKDVIGSDPNLIYPGQRLLIPKNP